MPTGGPLLQNRGHSSVSLGFWNYVGFWFHSLGQYNTALTHPESPFLVADDITSLVVLLTFSGWLLPNLQYAKRNLLSSPAKLCRRMRLSKYFNPWSPVRGPTEIERQLSLLPIEACPIAFLP